MYGAAPTSDSSYHCHCLAFHRNFQVFDRALFEPARSSLYCKIPKATAPSRPTTVTIQAIVVLTLIRAPGAIYHAPSIPNAEANRPPPASEAKMNMTHFAQCVVRQAWRYRTIHTAPEAITKTA